MPVAVAVEVPRTAADAGPIGRESEQRRVQVLIIRKLDGEFGTTCDWSSRG